MKPKKGYKQRFTMTSENQVPEIVVKGNFDEFKAILPQIKGDINRMYNVNPKTGTQECPPGYTKYNQTLLHLASYHGRFSIFKELLDNGADININCLDKTTVDIIVLNSNFPLLELFDKKLFEKELQKWEKEKNEVNKYFHIVHDDRDEILKRLLDDTDVEIDFNLVLGYACSYGAFKIINLCYNYYDIYKLIPTKEQNYTKSILFSTVRGRHLHLVESLLPNDKFQEIVSYMRENEERSEIFKKNLDACIIEICKMKNNGYDVKTVSDQTMIETLEILLKFGGSPTEKNHTKFYSWSFSDILDDLANKSLVFIKYILFKNLFNIYTVTDSFDRNIFENMINSKNVEKLKYFIEELGFDITKVDKNQENYLHKVYKPEPTEYFLSKLDEMGLVKEFLEQKNKHGFNPIEVHRKIKRVIDKYRLYVEIPEERKRGPEVEPGCKVYYSRKHAKTLDMFLNYNTVVLCFTDEHGDKVLCTWKSYPDENGDEYPVDDKKFVGIMTKDWKYNGIQCVGMLYDDSRCTRINPPGTPNACTSCWNRMRSALG